jgi:hypothetical protein
VKNESNIFRLSCEPRNCASREDHHTRLIEYDDRMRQEEKRYSRLLMELNKSRWLDQSSLHTNDGLNGFPKYDVDQPIDKGQSAELEVTRLTGDEILYGGGLTMEQALLKKKKPSALHVDERLDRNSTQHTMMFQSTLSPQKRNDTRSARIEMIQAAGCDKLESYGRESFPWESVMVESVGLVLQRWKGICSFSLSMVCDRNVDNINVIYHLSSEKQCRTDCPNSIKQGE